jgi:hypothetical protein
LNPVEHVISVSCEPLHHAPLFCENVVGIEITPPSGQVARFISF